MKTLNASMGVLALACLLSFSSCFGPGLPAQKLRIKTFTWEGTLFQAQYNPYGMLTRLQGNDRRIDFLYDENEKLYRSEIIINGEAIPSARYDFTQGPLGITQIRIYFAMSGQLHLTDIKTVHYISPTKFSSILEQEVSDEGDSIHVTFELDRQFTYRGNNVASITTIPAFTEYNAFTYDQKRNPFMLLAEAVGNPAFFPAGDFVNFPVRPYNIPLITVFSENNPIAAQYGTVGYPNSVDWQNFKYIYDNGLVKQIIWYDNYQNLYFQTRTFKFEYEWASCLPHVHHENK
ncbi:MAG TPA: hypothetical protein VIU12_31095 [Chryseolinea sp.]